MDKAESRNRYRPFAEEVPAFCRGLLDRLWMTGALQEALSVGSCFDARKVILTGSGVGYAAVLAGAPVFSEQCDIFFGTEVMAQADFNYFNNVAAMGIGEPNTPLVIVATEQADDPDAARTLEVAAQAGANSLLLCAADQSAQAGLARSALCLGLDGTAPDFLPRAYLALTLALVCAGYRIARVRGTVSELGLQRVREALQAYTASVPGCLDAAQAAAQDFARRCGDRDRFDYIADGEARASAHLLGTVGARLLGYQYAVNDSEEWCHVNYWMEQRFDLCTVMWGLRAQPSFSRTIETMGCVHKLERPYLFVTDADESAFLPGTRCCPVPAPPPGCRWMAQLICFLPALLALGELEQNKRGGGEK
ncbi:hypothetical protein H8S23_12850 [Anaerofilum sp. BX8]|uniref:SIS domain-containing protein n=1 Tax=Anaerofilum hominis TaxID=2763016 RepID=A0A923RFB8_9FIRM|nr:hypothetical protein [Anaerofilum hominis]MBC5582394.1 hypothetical protein [Anaerofilum hominis]